MAIQLKSKTLLGLLVGLLACGGVPQGGAGTAGAGAAGAGAAGAGSEGPAAHAGAESFRAKQPVAGAPRPFQLPPMQTFKVGGIDVYLVESHELPTISASLVFDGGAISDPKGKEGLASVCMDMMTEGTRKLDKIAFRKALADIGSDVWSWASKETQGLGMRTLSKNFDRTFALFVDSLKKPGFRNSDLKRMVKSRSESIKQAKGSAGAVAGRLLWSVTFGSGHAQARVTTEKSLKRLRTNDCTRYQKQALRPNGARLFVVGDLTKAQVQKALSPVLSTWKGKAKVAKAGPREPRQGRIFFVDVPGAKQSSIYLTQPGPRRKNPQYFANWMMSQIFGGSFSARVNMNLREDKGYSYGARAGISYTRDFGTLYVGSSVRADSTIQSIRELHKEMQDMGHARRAATQPELTREKNGAILALPARFATAKSALSQYRNLVYHGLPLGYYSTFVSKIERVELDQVKVASGAWLKTYDIKLLVVGDAKAKMKIRKGDEDVDYVDRDGKPIGLLMGLQMMAAEKELGPGALVVLDADGKIKQR